MRGNVRLCIIIHVWHTKCDEVELCERARQRPHLFSPPSPGPLARTLFFFRQLLCAKRDLSRSQFLIKHVCFEGTNPIERGLLASAANEDFFWYPSALCRSDKIL